MKINTLHVYRWAIDKGASSLETGMIIGIASLTLTIFAPIVGYFVSPNSKINSIGINSHHVILR